MSERERSRQCLLAEISQPEADISLARAALYIAQETYPDLDIEVYLSQLDALAAAIAPQLPAERYPLRILSAISQFLYGDRGFTGNAQDYYDPRNSFLNEVLDRRTGIPITLALVYLEVAKRLDFPMVGVGMPGHFLLRPVVDEMEVWVDAFYQGEVLFREDCQQRLSQVYGRPTVLQPEFLQPVSARQFLTRILTNLKLIYHQRGDLWSALSMVDRILLIAPEADAELRDRGVLHYQLHQWTQASADLEAYLARSPLASDADAVRRLLTKIADRSL